jgi:acetolactate synthase-1/2/3 large subunit
MLVASAVGEALARSDVEVAFGLVGSGNFHVTNALVAAGARFVPAAHEGGAATMADAYARVSGKVGVLSLHQGPGVTNALTGVAEAAKSRTPMLVLAAEATAAHSNFHIDLAGAASAVGADFFRVRAAESAVEDALAAYRAAARGRTVLLGLPLDVQAMKTEPAVVDGPAVPQPEPVAEEAQAVRLAEALLSARRPVFVAGRWPGSPTTVARCSPSPRPRRACSPATRGIWTSAAGSPPRSPPSWWPVPTWWWRGGAR